MVRLYIYKLTNTFESKDICKLKLIFTTLITANEAVNFFS